MQPTLGQIIDLGQGLSAALTNSLEDLGHVSHVEGVVGLRRCGQELLQHSTVDLQGGSDSTRSSSKHISCHDTHELVNHRHKDTAQAFFVEGSHEEQVEPTRVTICDIVLAASWRAHCSQHVDVNELSELPSLAVVPTISHWCQDEHLTQNLNGRLGTILFLEGHVEIINEDQHLLVGRWSKCALLTLVQLAVNDILRLVGSGLCREGKSIG
mmetsp:Transcript_18729/g.39168  ORF Transcript_18729/g.39168 Transcript_18729/m.39168 type:complete len:212 (+) Transcript_18729:421-1056(+)